MMIDINKKYRTRDGREVRIYATDTGAKQPIHGAFKNPSGAWVQNSWKHSGEDWYAFPDCDLFEVRPRHKRTVWVTVYPMNRYQISDDNIQCDIYPPKRIACIKVELDFEEGEGL